MGAIWQGRGIGGSDRRVEMRRGRESQVEGTEVEGKTQVTGQYRGEEGRLTEPRCVTLIGNFFVRKIEEQISCTGWSQTLAWDLSSDTARSRKRVGKNSGMHDDDDGCGWKKKKEKERGKTRISSPATLGQQHDTTTIMTGVELIAVFSSDTWQLYFYL